MSETTTQAAQSLNGQGSARAEHAPEAGPLFDVTGGERALAILAIAFGVLVILIGIDMGSGGRLSGYIAERRGPSEP